MKIKSFLYKIPIYILIAIAIINIIFGIFALLRIITDFNKEAFLLFAVFWQIIIYVIYMVGAIGLLKKKLWAWYLTLSFLGIGILLQIINQDISLAIFYFVIIASLVFYKKSIKKS